MIIIELVEMILKRGALQFGSFPFKHHEKYPDAPISPNLINLRTRNNPKPGPLKLVDCELIARHIWQLVQKTGLIFSAIAGIPNAAVPFIEAIESIVAAPMGFRILPLSKVMDGKKRRVVPTSGYAYRPGEILLLVDDVLSWAETKREVLAGMRGNGVIIRDLIVVVDREEGGVELMKSLGVRVHALLTQTKILEFGLNQNRISSSQFRESMEYMQLSRNFPR